MNQKILIYQLLPRLFGNSIATNIYNGSIKMNGSGKLNDITTTVLHKLKTDGYTHIWYIGVLAHASTSDYSDYGIPGTFPELCKGRAGSPYAIRDYYDVDPDLAVKVAGRMSEFEALIHRTHAAGLKVIIDNVPNHVARNYCSVNKPKGMRDFGENDDNTVAFSSQNNYYYIPGQPLEIEHAKMEADAFAYREFPAKVTGNDCFTNKPGRFDWYETVKLNYGVDYLNGNQPYFNPIPDTWLKMRDIFLFWAEKKVDGFRCDMAEMVPLSFWRWVIPQVKEKYPGIIFLAEIYNPAVYRDFIAENTFDYLYDKVGLYDMLRDVSLGHRPSSDITFTLNSVGDIQSNMLNFLENHDEQRIASDYFLKEGSKAKAAMIVTCCINTNPVMIYFGQELGERGMDEEGFSGKNGRTSIFDYWSMDTIRRWNNNGKWDDEHLSENERELKAFYKKLLTLCNSEPALANGLFYDLMSANYENREFDATRLFAFLRSDKNDILLIVTNFDNKVHECTVHIPEHAFAFLEIPKKRGKMTPLLNTAGAEIPFSFDSFPRISLDSFSGEIYKISFGE